MNRLLASSALALAALTLAGAALADNYSSYMTISGLEQINDEYVVYPSALTNNATNNPASCSAGVGRYYFYTAGTSTASRELMTRTLMSAFLAGKKTQLMVKAGAGSCYNNYPIFYQISTDNS